VNVITTINQVLVAYSRYLTLKSCQKIKIRNYGGVTKTDVIKRWWCWYQPSNYQRRTENQEIIRVNNNVKKHHQHRYIGIYVTDPQTSCVLHLNSGTRTAYPSAAPEFTSGF